MVISLPSMVYYPFISGERIVSSGLFAIYGLVAIVSCLLLFFKYNWSWIFISSWLLYQISLGLSNLFLFPSYTAGSGSIVSIHYIYLFCATVFFYSSPVIKYFKMGKKEVLISIGLSICFLVLALIGNSSVLQTG